MTQLEQLEGMGYRLTLDNGGKIRASLPGGLPPPPGARELLAWCREHREEVRDALIFRSGKVKPAVRVDVWQPVVDDPRIWAWKSVFDRGLAELVKVICHRRGGKEGDIYRIEVHYIPIAEEWVIESEVNAR